MPSFDDITNRVINRIVVPSTYLLTILTLIHQKANHPSKYQTEKLFARYFFAPANFAKVLRDYYDQCMVCSSLKKNLASPVCTGIKAPQQPGVQFSCDVVKRAGQNVLVCVDDFSLYATAVLVSSEKVSDLLDAVVAVTTPVRRSASIVVRTDKAPAFASLSRGQGLLSAGIEIRLPGSDFNKNQNALVDRLIQDLQSEFRRLAPPGQALSSSVLAKALFFVNSRIRRSGLSASEVLFSRDGLSGENLLVNDRDLSSSVSESRHSARPVAPAPVEQPRPGAIVHLKRNDKNAPRDPFVVVDARDGLCTVAKVLHASPSDPAPAKVSSKPLTVRPHLLETFAQGPVSRVRHAVVDRPVMTIEPRALFSPAGELGVDSDSESDVVSHSWRSCYLPPSPVEGRCVDIVSWRARYLPGRHVASPIAAWRERFLPPLAELRAAPPCPRPDSPVDCVSAAQAVALCQGPPPPACSPPARQPPQRKAAAAAEVLSRQMLSGRRIPQVDGAWSLPSSVEPSPEASLLSPGPVGSFALLPTAPVRPWDVHIASATYDRLAASRYGDDEVPERSMWKKIGRVPVVPPSPRVVELKERLYAQLELLPPAPPFQTAAAEHLWSLKL